MNAIYIRIIEVKNFLIFVNYDGIGRHPLRARNYI